jgi:hypothetical protein
VSSGRPAEGPSRARRAFASQPAASGPDVAAAAPWTDDGAAEREVVETGYGGLLYLVNVGLFLDLYGDFAQPLRKGIPLPIWDFVALVGERLAGPRLRRDPIWPLLARLAGRSSDEPPGHRFRPPAAWRLPPEWLKPFPEPSTWRWSASDGRLRVRHPAGFPVLDLPVAATGPDRQLRRALGPYRRLAGRFQAEPLPERSLSLRDRARVRAPTAPPIGRPAVTGPSPALRAPSPGGRGIVLRPSVVGGDPATAQLTSGRTRVGPRGHGDRHGAIAVRPARRPWPWPGPEASRLDRWLDWLMPYLRARLRRALGLPRARQIGRVLLRHRARLVLTPTELEVVLSLGNLPIEVRLAGLDRDPGWVPAAGRFVAFRFE